MGEEGSALEADLKAAVLEFMQFKYTQAGLKSLERCDDKRGSALTVYLAIVKDSPALYDRLKEHFAGQDLKQRDESCVTLIRQAFREATTGGKELSSLVVPKPDQHRARHGKLMPATVSGMREWAN